MLPTSRTFSEPSFPPTQRMGNQPPHPQVEDPPVNTSQQTHVCTSGHTNRHPPSAFMAHLPLFLQHMPSDGVPMQTFLTCSSHYLEDLISYRLDSGAPDSQRAPSPRPSPTPAGAGADQVTTCQHFAECFAQTAAEWPQLDPLCTVLLEAESRVECLVVIAKALMVWAQFECPACEGGVSLPQPWAWASEVGGRDVLERPTTIGPPPPSPTKVTRVGKNQIH